MSEQLVVSIFLVDLAGECESSGCYSGIAEDSCLYGCDAVLLAKRRELLTLTTRLYIPEDLQLDLEDRRIRLARHIGDHVPDCTVSSQ